MKPTCEQVSKLVHPCPNCNKKPRLWEENFFGYAVPKFRVKCLNCGRKTTHYQFAKAAISAWNKGKTQEKRPEDEFIDNDAMIDLLGDVLGAAIEDYIGFASHENPTSAELTEMEHIEEFIEENPYALPYNVDYMLDKMHREGEKARKMHVS